MSEENEKKAGPQPHGFQYDVCKCEKPTPAQGMGEDFLEVPNAAGQHVSIEKSVASVGLKYDEGKLRYDLLPPDAVKAIVRVLTYGSVKYAPRNWENGIYQSRLMAASRRHEAAWEMGEDFDPETGIHHLAHKACCDIMMLAQELRGMTNFDDIPSRVAAVENKDIAIVISTEQGE